MSMERSIDGSFDTLQFIYKNEVDEEVSATSNASHELDNPLNCGPQLSVTPSFDADEFQRVSYVQHDDVYQTLVEAEYFFNNAIYEMYHADLYAFIFHSTRSADEASDILQETFVSAWQHLFLLSSLESKSRRSWLFKTALNKVRDAYRRSKSRENSLLKWKQQILLEQEGQRAPEELAGAQEQFWDILQQLSKRERECLILISQGWEPAEVGKVLGVGASSVRSYMTHVKQKYIKALKKMQ